MLTLVDLTSPMLRHAMGIKPSFSLALEICFWTLLAGVGSAESPALPSIEVQLDGRKLANASVEYVPKRLEQNETIAGLIAKQGIVADNEAYSAVYQVNPALSFGQIKSGSQVLVPSISGAKNMLEGSRVRLVVDKGTKVNFIASVKELESVAPSIQQLSNSRFEEGVDVKKVKEDVGSIAKTLTSLSDIAADKSAPISSQMLRQMSAESAELLVLGTSISRGERKVTTSDSEMVRAIRESLDVRVESFRLHAGPNNQPPSWKVSFVRVNVRKQQDQTLVNGYRVFYVPAGLANWPDKYKEAFPGLSSPSEDYMPEANYLVWAEQPQGNGAQTDKVRLRARQNPNGKPQLLDLSL